MESSLNVDSPDYDQDAHGFIAHAASTGDRLLSLANRISKLEHDKGIRNDYIPEVVQKTAKYLCPTKNCDKKYIDPSDLGKHCHEKHCLMRSILSQRVCYRYAKSFPTTQEFIRHEKEEYDSHITSFQHFPFAFPFPIQLPVSAKQSV